MEILPGISVIVEPASSAFFAGELMQWKITFRNDRQPARKLETLFPVPHSSDSTGHRHALSIATSTLALQSTFDRKGAANLKSRVPASPGSATSPSRSFVDLNNANSDSTHLVLPTRRGNMGTHLPHRLSRRTRSQNGSRHLAADGGATQSLAPPIHLYEARRTPAGLLRHKKNDYSVAIGHHSGDLSSTNGDTWGQSSDDVLDDGHAVLDLSSQLAGLAMLQQQAGTLSCTDHTSGAVQTGGNAYVLSRSPNIHRSTSFSGPSNFTEDTVNDFAKNALAKQPCSVQHNRAVSALSGLPPAPVSPLHRATSSHSPTGLNKGVQILWSYAKFDGSFVIDPALIRDQEFQAVKHAMFGDAQHLHGRVAASGASEAVIGGGTLDIESETRSARKSTWGSWLWRQSDDTRSNVSSARSTNAGTQADVDSNSQPRGSMTAARKLQRKTFASDPSTSGTLEDHRQRILQSSNMPIITCPNSIIAVDLRLMPGESRSFTYSLLLPADLPPTYRGRSIAINYALETGLVLADFDRLGQMGGSISRRFHMPVRIYNNVSVAGFRPFFDLTNPHTLHHDPAKVSPMQQPDSPTALTVLPSLSTSRQRSKSLMEEMQLAANARLQKEGFERYAKSLLDQTDLAKDAPNLHGRHAANEFDQDAEGDTCRNAVEVVSRNAQRVAYDINKDGYRIATATLVKSAYRLGDTVNLAIALNLPLDEDRSDAMPARVYRIAVRLETHELIETSISMKSAAQTRTMTTRLHAEHHEVTLDSGRVGCSLAIPSGATPDFSTSGIKLQWVLRIAFLIKPPAQWTGISSHSETNLPSHFLPVPPDKPEQDYTSYRAVPDLSYSPMLFQATVKNASARQGKDTVALVPVKLETIEVNIPLRVYPSATPFKPPVAIFAA